MNAPLIINPKNYSIDNELRAKLDAILASGDETEYVRHNPILREKVDNGLRAFERGEGFIVSPTQLGINLDNQKMRSLSFVNDSWQDYVILGATDKKLINKTNEIIKEMLRRDDPSQGIGQPEPLKPEYAGCYARHLSKKDRLIYRFDDDKIKIISIGGHYDDH